MRTPVIVIAAIATAAMFVAGCGGASTKQAATPNTSASTKGAFVKDCTAVVGDNAACRALTVTHVTCAWDGDHVRVAATFANSLEAHVTVHVEPTYTLKNAGQHGDGLTNWTDVGVDAGATRAWTHDVGHPAGVKGTPAIRVCNPRLALNGVELG